MYKLVLSTYQENESHSKTEDKCITFNTFSLKPTFLKRCNNVLKQKSMLLLNLSLAYIYDVCGMLQNTWGTIIIFIL